MSKGSEETIISGTKGSGFKKGLRCHVCTGCGLCPGVRSENGLRDVRILMKDGVSQGQTSLQNSAGYRLIACDVGTTTIAMELYGENGEVVSHFVTVNPQVEFGSDVLSRIEAAKDPACREKMREMVRSALAQGAERFLKCLKKSEKPLMIIAANTTMSYLLMGWEPEELGRAPFEASRLCGAKFDLQGIPCTLLPGFSAFVGGDLFAGAIACDMDGSSELTLLIDLGTNGEILLGSREGILATATAAGPAFEGGANRGIWGADLVKYVACLRREGMLDKTGLLAEPYFTSGVRVGNVMLTKESIRSLQVAKAAIMAGIQILLRHSGHALEEIDRVVLAGGFGYYLNPKDAAEIGLIPASLSEKAFAGGNTALSGAKKIGARMLRNVTRGDFFEKALAGEVLPDLRKNESIWTQGVVTEVVNLAMQPDFQKVYLASMSLEPMDF